MSNIQKIKKFTNLQILEGEQTIVLNYNQYQGFLELENYIEHTFLVNVRDIKQFPLKGNLRVPTVTQPCKSMFRTIQMEPATFAEKNMGVFIQLHEMLLNTEKKEVTLKFNGVDDGNVNGAHSVAVGLESQKLGFDLSKVFIKVYIRVYKQETNSKIASETAVALNTSEKQTSYAEGELAGYHDVFYRQSSIVKEAFDGVPNLRKRLGNPFIRTIEDLTALLTAFDTITYNINNKRNKHALMKVGSKKSTYLNWLKKVKQDETPAIMTLLPLLEDIVLLYDEVTCSFQEYGEYTLLKNGEIENKKLSKKIINSLKVSKNTTELYSTISGRKYEYIPETQMFYCVLSAYRANILYNSETGEISWIVDPNKLLKRVNSTLWGIIADRCDKINSVTDTVKNTFCRKESIDMWSLLYSEVEKEILKMKNEEATKKLELQMEEMQNEINKTIKGKKVA